MKIPANKLQPCYQVLGQFDLKQKIFFEILEDFLSQEIKTRFLANNLIQEVELQ